MFTALHNRDVPALRALLAGSGGRQAAVENLKGGFAAAPLLLQGLPPQALPPPPAGMAAAATVTPALLHTGGITPLHAAALLGVADAVPLLLQAGADVDAPRQVRELVVAHMTASLPVPRSVDGYRQTDRSRAP